MSRPRRQQHTHHIPGGVPPTDYVVCLGCGKRGYATRSQAKKAARRTARIAGEPISWWNVYECEDGLDECFHAGHRYRREAC